MIELIATAESVAQAEALLAIGVDTIQIGCETFGLRLPASFSDEEHREIVSITKTHGKQCEVAVNALFHNEQIEAVPAYLAFLREIGVTRITVGDPGVVQLMKNSELAIPFRHDTQVLVTSSKQVNFWAKRGAVGAVLARELPFAELEMIAQESLVPVEVLVYGATCIHQSRRRLLDNYLQFLGSQPQDVSRQRGLFLSEPQRVDSHYSIYQDGNGTHVFATNDLNLMPHLAALHQAGLHQWKLDGLFTPGPAFVDVATQFVRARELLLAGAWCSELAEQLSARVREYHPRNRELDCGFFVKQPNEVR